MTERNNRKWHPGRSATQRLGILEWLRPGEYEHAEKTQLLDQETARFSPTTVTKGGLRNAHLR